ncbi:MAG: hypothetical protein NW205_11780 [Hyphomicrobiaceae bacterium]|nr:hypothetical protein [Hyphomicrobiaceae bacterium]
MRRGAFAAARRWLASVAITGLCLDMATGQPKAESATRIGLDAESAAVLAGAWVAEECRDGPPSVLALGDDGTLSIASAAEPVTCGLTAQRRQHRSRWYLDFDCGAQGRADFDVNALADGRLLVAQRPLGVACAYRRARR